MICKETLVKRLSPALVVMLAGALLALGSAIALAASPAARGGQARPTVAKTTRAPLLPKQKRGLVVRQSKFFACPHGNGVCVRTTTMGLSMPRGGSSG